MENITKNKLFAKHFNRVKIERVVDQETDRTCLLANLLGRTMNVDLKRLGY